VQVKSPGAEVCEGGVAPLLVLLTLLMLLPLLPLLLATEGSGGVQVLSQASFPRLFRIIDRSQTLVQFTSRQVIYDPDGVSTAPVFPPLQHATNTQTSSNPSLEIVPGGLAHRSLSIVNGRQVSAAVRNFAYSTVDKTAASRYFIAVFVEGEKQFEDKGLFYCGCRNLRVLSTK
jgi:hypothetical protein